MACWYRIDEYYYDSRREGAQRTDEEHYAGLVELCGGRRIECVVVDPSAASFMETIRRPWGLRVLPAENDVLDGIRRVSVALKQGEIKICANCADACPGSLGSIAGRMWRERTRRSRKTTMRWTTSGIL